MLHYLYIIVILSHWKLTDQNFLHRTNAISMVTVYVLNISFESVSTAFKHEAAMRPSI